MNLPNKLTLLRLGLTALFVASFSMPFAHAGTLALAVFLSASFTDWLDGWLARRWNLITDFGRLMDPLADKVLTASAFICLIPSIPAWAVILIIAREFLVTGLRLLAGSKGIVLPAERLGKHKTFWQMATILYFLGVRAAEEWWARADGLAWVKITGQALVALAVVLTVASGLGYLWRHRALVRE